jgi:hypothetical protein
MTDRKCSIMTSAPPAESSTQLKRFSEWYSGWDHTKQDHFLDELGKRARKLVGPDKADDLTQDVMLALLRSSTPYPCIEPGLAICKAEELAPRYWRWSPHIELSDDLPDPGDDPFQALERREDAEQQTRQTEMRRATVLDAASPKQRELVLFLEGVDRNRTSDDEKDPYRHGPTDLQFDDQEIANRRNAAGYNDTPEDIASTIWALKKRLRRRGFKPKGKRRRRTSTTAA